MAIKISVIIPFYNRRTELPVAVRSVLAQSYEHYELILVDDASTDASAEMLRSAFPDPRIRFITHEKNKGAAAARNTGIQNATGDYIAFLDSDDTWHPDKLKLHLDFVLKNNTDVSCTSFVLIKPDGSKEMRRLPTQANWSTEFIYGCFVSPGSTMIAKREVFGQIGLLDGELRRLEDWDWLLRLTNNQKFAAFDQALSEVHVSGYPSLDAIEQAISKLKERHISNINQRHPHGQALFLASMQLELAHTAFHNKRTLLALAYLAKAWKLSPHRVLILIKKILSQS